MVEQRSPKPRAEGSSPSAPAKNKVSLLRYLVFCCVKGLCSPRHAERAGHRRRSAAGGGYSEAVMAQRSKLLAAPRQKQFWAPQEGLRSKFKSLKPLPYKKSQNPLVVRVSGLFYFSGVVNFIANFLLFYFVIFRKMPFFYLFWAIFFVKSS